MKKWFVVSIAFLVVCGMSGIVQAGCHNCEKCPDGYLNCDIGAGQGEEPECDFFDYECRCMAHLNNQGYWCNVSVGCGPLDTCRVIFDICQCEDVEENFDSGQTIGIRMTLMINGVFAEADDGFYFSQTPWGTNVLETFASLDEACAAETQTKSFGTTTFYDDADAAVASVVTPRTGMGGPCPVAAANQAVMMCTDQGQGFTITQAVEVNQQSKWWIDTPYFRIDPNILHNQELLSVKIELLNAESGGICATCESICECIVDIAIVCCPLSLYEDCSVLPLRSPG